MDLPHSRISHSTYTEGNDVAGMCTISSVLFQDFHYLALSYFSRNSSKIHVWIVIKSIFLTQIWVPDPDLHEKNNYRTKMHHSWSSKIDDITIMDRHQKLTSDLCPDSLLVKSSCERISRRSILLSRLPVDKRDELQAKDPTLNRCPSIVLTLLQCAASHIWKRLKINKYSLSMSNTKNKKSSPNSMRKKKLYQTQKRLRANNTKNSSCPDDELQISIFFKSRNVTSTNPKKHCSFHNPDNKKILHPSSLLE